MAKRRGRKKATRRTKYKRAFNLKNALFSYLTLDAGTRWATNNSPYNFLFAGYLPNVAGISGASNIALKEIIAGQSAGYSSPSHDLMLNLKNNMIDNAPQLVMTLVGLKIGKKVIESAGLTRAFNKTVRSIGMGDLVKM